MIFPKQKPYQVALRYVVIALCAILLALNYVLFIVKNSFAPAGINGIATMIQHKLGFSIGYFSLIINIPLCVLAFLLGHKDFALKTLVFSVVYSATYVLFQNMDFSRFAYDSNGEDVILPVLAAGAISGFVYGSVFKFNGSTGGTDVVAKIISNRNPRFSFVWVIFTINVIVATASYFVYGTEVDGEIVYSFKPVILCIVYCFTSSAIGNMMLKGANGALKVEIITNDSEAICDKILHQLKHGATIVNAKGAYTHGDKQYVVCIINKHQLTDMYALLSQFSDTFVCVSDVYSTLGNFKFIK